MDHSSLKEKESESSVTTYQVDPTYKIDPVAEAKLRRKLDLL